MNKLYDALENCLQSLEQGQDLDSVLARYPKLAEELRPMLEASLLARTSSDHTIQIGAQRRGRARLMQRAAEMREAKRSRRRMIPMFSRWAITFGVAGALFLSSTGLVSASSGTLPGDQLYPVKRTWEDVRLLFVFNPQGRNILESQYEQERLNEIDELLMKGRAAPITFSGLVVSQQNGQWMISGIPVSVTGSTRLPTGTVASGVPVMVVGVTQNDGTVDAHEIQLLQPGVSLPPLEPSGDNDQNGETDNENHRSQSTPSAENNNAQVTPLPIIITTPGANISGVQSLSQQRGYEFSGVVESMQGNVWNINGQSVIADQAQISGAVKVGSTVKFEGYYDPNGNFIVTKVEVKSVITRSTDSNNTDGGSGGSGTSGSGSGSDGNTNSNDNHYENNTNGNTNTQNYNENDH